MLRGRASSRRISLSRVNPDYEQLLINDAIVTQQMVINLIRCFKVYDMENLRKEGMKLVEETGMKSEVEIGRHCGTKVSVGRLDSLLSLRKW